MDTYRGYIITENFNERGSEMELLFFGKEEKLKYKGNLVITKNSPMIVRSTMGVLLPRTQINSPMIVRSTMGVLLPRTQINSM